MAVNTVREVTFQPASDVTVMLGASSRVIGVSMTGPRPVVIYLADPSEANDTEVHVYCAAADGGTMDAGSQPTTDTYLGHVVVASTTWHCFASL